MMADRFGRPEFHPDRPQRVGCHPSLLTKAAIQAANSLNVGNQRDTGHSAEVTSPAAMADQQKYVPISQLAAYSPTSAVQ